MKEGNTMKNWNIPAAYIQEFAANDYVSACTATIDCNVPVEAPFGYYIQEYGKTYECQGVGPRTYGYYSPCGAKHDVGAHGELVKITMTQGLIPDANGEYNRNLRVDLPEPVECYAWFVMNDEGVVQNVHTTLSPDGFEANKS